MRLPGSQSRNRHHDCHDCYWWCPGYCITRRHNQWHVLDDDHFTRDSRIRHWRYYIIKRLNPLLIFIYIIGEYPASSTSASEAANEFTLKKRGPIFILVTNLPLSFGGPLAVCIFLIVLSATTTKHLSTLWRVTFGIGCLLPLTVFYFRIKMLNSKLYRRGAIKRKVPYLLVIRYYWKSLIGTCGAWFLYDFVCGCHSLLG